ncbi:MAG TPA: glycosyltransferase family 39 protein, partial [Anaerolineales bacterium]|nr:glycosyltransferase family 39 protein [Anaerolineales bacterium]
MLPFLMLGLVGSFLVYYATAWGPWAFSDAAGYITAARNLVAGHGIGFFRPNGEFSPTVSHPPLYVLTLGAVSQVGLEPLQAARALDVLLFGLLVAACGIMLCRALVSRRAGLAFSALLLVHPALLIAYTSAMAEPPFILLGLLSLLLMADHFREPRNVTFVGAALSAGGALLSRYPGAAFVLTGAA